MIAGYDHQRTENDFCVACFGDLFDHCFACCVFRFAFHSTDEYIVISELRHLCLHLAVGNLGSVGGSVSQENKSGVIILCGVKVFVSGVGDSGGSHGFRHSGFVLVDNSGIGSYLSEKRFGNLYGFKLIPVFVYCICQFVVFRSVHQVCGLNHQIFYAVCDCAIQRLLHIVDLFAVAGLDVIDNDLRGKCSPDGPVGIRCLKCVFDPFDIRNTAVIEGSAEAYHKKFIFTDAVAVERVIVGSVAGIAAEVIRIGIFSGYQFFLRVCQRIPGGLCFLALGVRVICAFLYIDGVGQGGDIVCGFLVGRSFPRGTVRGRTAGGRSIFTGRDCRYRWGSRRTGRRFPSGSSASCKKRARDSGGAQQRHDFFSFHFSFSFFMDLQFIRE